VLAGHAALRVPVEAVPELRKQPGPPLGKPLPVNCLKHAEEQTVVAVAAVLQAVAAHHLAPDGTPDGFRDWGVVAGPRFLGRSAMAAALPRFVAEGAWDVSPHVIPHRSLHAVSGTLSQALKIHGPNFGVGGGPCGETEALLAAAALLADRPLPGVWVVLTRMDPELPDDGKTGRPAPGTFCQAVALALLPAGAAGPATLELSVGPHAQPPAALTLAVLADLLGRLQHAPQASHPLGKAGLLTLRRTAAPLAGPHFALRAGRDLPQS
jgi:hypothetical protein